MLMTRCTRLCLSAGRHVPSSTSIFLQQQQQQQRRNLYIASPDDGDMRRPPPPHDPYSSLVSQAKAAMSSMLNQLQAAQGTIKSYGLVGAGVYGALSVASLSASYLLVQSVGVDALSVLPLDSLLDLFPVAADTVSPSADVLTAATSAVPSSSTAKSLGSFAVAYLLHKATLPVRLPLAVYLTPRVAARIRALRA
eukprot:EC852430.1.p1 GENE.EC852430.1~~EC852430.1.p1  ORF type:complete len:195 (+),score=72.48 EC852430.1:124-708(+)